MKSSYSNFQLQYPQCTLLPYVHSTYFMMVGPTWMIRPESSGWKEIPSLSREQQAMFCIPFVAWCHKITTLKQWNYHNVLRLGNFQWEINIWVFMPVIENGGYLFSKRWKLSGEKKSKNDKRISWFRVSINSMQSLHIYCVHSWGLASLVWMEYSVL